MNKEDLYSKLGRLLGYDKLKTKVLFRTMDSESIFKLINDETDRIAFKDISMETGILNDIGISEDVLYFKDRDLRELVEDLYFDKYKDKFENLINEFHKEIKREWMEDDVFYHEMVDNIKKPEYCEDGGLIFVHEMIERRFMSHFKNELEIIMKDIKSLDKKEV